MTDYSGNVVLGGSPASWPNDVAWSRRQRPFPFRPWEPGAPGRGTHTDTQPVTDERGLDHAGQIQQQFGFLDFYNRFHFTPGRFDLGNVLTVTRPIRVFNAYFTPQKLLSVTPTNAEGISIELPVATPFYFQGLQELTLQVTVTPEGPPVIAATFTFDFATAIDYVFPISGTRVIAWTWEPDWTAPVSERWEWLTDVMVAYDGEEQRRALRQFPRWGFRFQFSETGDERADLENAIRFAGAKLWALPIFTDGAPLTAAALAGDTEIFLDTATRDFHVGGLAILIAPGVPPELLSIDTVNPTSLELEAPLVSDWPNRAACYPVRSARLQLAQGYARRNAQRIEGEAVFVCDDAPALTALSETTYRSFPVVTERFNWRQPPVLAQERKVEIFDPGLSSPTWLDESGMPSYLQSVLWTALNRTEIDTMRRFLHTRRGRYKAVWLPTWARDLELANDMPNGAESIVVRHAHITTYLGDSANRRDIRIELNNGSVYYRHADAYTEISADLERIDFTPPLGVEMKVSDVKLICFMALTRLDQDGIEIAFSAVNVAESQVNFRSFNNDA